MSRLIVAGVDLSRLKRIGSGGGPVAVVYPEGVWYSFVDLSDVDEIVESHLKKGEIVERLLVPAHVGR